LRVGGGDGGGTPVRFSAIEVVKTRWGGEGAASVVSSRRGGMGGQEGRGERWWKEEEAARRRECISCWLGREDDKGN
jgi:hypothetical protein